MTSKEADLHAFVVSTRETMQLVDAQANKVLEAVKEADIMVQRHGERERIKNLATNLSQCLDFAVKLHRCTQRTVLCADDEISKLVKVAEVDIDERPLVLTPEEQELAYELKAQMMRNIWGQCNNIKAELSLQKRIKSLDHEGEGGPMRASELSRTNALRLMKVFERKSKAANEQLTLIASELKKAQATATKYQTMYTSLKKRQGAMTSSDSSLVGQKGGGGKVENRVNGWNVDETVRRMGLMHEQNERLRDDVARLRHENKNLTVTAKHAEEARVIALNHLTTSENDREGLAKRLSKEQKQYAKLQSSLNSQASGWVASRQASRASFYNTRSTRIMGPMPVCEYDRQLPKSRIQSAGPSGRRC